MLEINKITKIYKLEDFTQKALDEVSINFRECEFVSILGPSGSGKTTLLNIIGGLDKYTSGDLIINGVSTKKYKDRDWDSYRNHRIGFVFQSYNLISHQSILRNVELALTLSGVSKKERVKKAKQALKEVGLENHMNKRPNQLSGGQMQRVAIARALINDPDILLADEPTGALDTATSKQIMKLLKNVAKDKLVIMVTHNAELAEEYSTRIIKLQDGKILDDSKPFNDKEKVLEKDEIRNLKSKKTSMSFITALSLSLNNLLTKKGRTILTSFAGSIGIIGIALILSLSNGFQNYIDKLQEDTLSSYPLTIQSETMDFTSLMVSMMEASESNEDTNGKVVETQQFAKMFSSVTTNDLKSFKKYLEDNKNALDKDVKHISYTYSIDPVIYTKQNNKIFQVNPNSIFTSMFGGNSITSTFSSNSSVFLGMSKDEIKDLKDNYKILEGHWSNNYDEIMLVLPNDNTIPDLVLYMIGLRDMDELYDVMSKVMTGEKVEIKNEPLEFEYKDFLNLEYKLLNKVDFYKYNDKYNIYEDMKDDESYIRNLYNNGTKLKVVGVISPKDGGSSMLSGGFIYNTDLIKNIIDNASNTDIVKKQLANEEIDVFSNTRFDEPKRNDMSFEDFISVDTNMLQSAFNMNISDNDVKNMTSGYMEEISNSISTDITPAKEKLNNDLNNIANGLFKYASTKNSVALNEVDNIINEYLNTDEVNSILNDLETSYLIPANIYKTAFESILKGILTGFISGYAMMDPTLTTDSNNPVAKVVGDNFDNIINPFMDNAEVIVAMETLAKNMVEAKMKSEILTKVGELTQTLMMSISSSFNIDSEKIAQAFKFNLDEKELARLMNAMKTTEDANASSNLLNLGYQNLEEPTAISVKFYSFTSKQNFLDVIEKYNKDVLKKGEEDKEINFTDTTGILMSSVKKIVDSVSYVLIAFVSIALVVSSIMIGIITYISVLERTKEIGILRAIGASKRNISSIFNAETFIIGLLSGLLGIGVTLSLIPIINNIIHSLTGNNNINASIPFMASIILIILSIILTLIGGLIPSRIASKKDPVIALRTE